MSERPLNVKVGDRVRVTTAHTGTVTRIDNDRFVLELKPGRVIHGNFHGDGEMTWVVLAPELPARDRAIADRDALLDALDAAKAHNDANCSSLYLLAAQQPVIDAARAWRGIVRLTEAVMGTEAGSEWCLTPQSKALADAIDALDAAETEPPC